MDIYIWATPIVTAGIGWGTNWLAVKMLFRPKKVWNFGLFKIQGMVPKRKIALASAIGSLVHEKLISHDELSKACQALDVKKDLEGLLDVKVDHFISSLKNEMPMMKMFLGGELSAKIKRKIIDSLLESEEEFKELVAKSIHKQMNIAHIVGEKVKNFSLKELEELVLHVAKKELKAIEVLGGVLGFLIGVLQVLILYFIQ